MKAGAAFTFRWPAIFEAQPKRSRWWLMLVLAGFGGSAGIAPAAPASTARTLSLSYKFAQPVVEHHEGRARITISGCDSLARVGEPALPFRTAKILLPPGYKIEGVSVSLPQAPIALPGDYGLDPTHRNTDSPKHRFTDSPLHHSITPSFHHSPQLLSVHRMLGCDIALVRLFPVQYRSAENRLHFSPQMDLIVSLTAQDTSAGAPFLAPGQARARDRVASWVDNPAILTEYLNPQAAAYHPITPSLHHPITPSLDYLLVTRESLAASFQPLIKQKIRDGLSARLETIEAITASQPGRDVPEKIRNYLRYACTNWGVQSVLLGGDVSVVPCRYAYVVRRLTERECLVPCDLYYACLDGSWNRDGDARWGETTDGEGGGDVDLLAEVDVGRAPVDTPAEAAAFVEKTLRHAERNRPDAAQALFLGAFLEQGSAQGGEMFSGTVLEPVQPGTPGGTGLKPVPRFALRTLDDRPFKTPQWHATDVLRELNAGPDLVLYCGHADADSIMRLSRPDLEALTNEPPFLFCSVGCNAGSFDNDQFSPDSIGEELVKRPRYGAFAAVLNSRLGWFDARQEWKYSGEFQHKLLEQLTRQDQVDLGRACTSARSELLGQVERTGSMTYRFCYYGLTLFGDPGVSLKVPKGTTRDHGRHPITSNFEFRISNFPFDTYAGAALRR